MITLHGSHRSPNTARVRWCLEEIGVSHTVAWVDLAKGEQKSPAYRAINPNGRVPTLVDGTFTIWESNAILSYLGDAYGQGSVVPPDVRGRGEVHQWLFWQSNDLGPALWAPWLMKFQAAVGRAVFNPDAFASAMEQARSTLALFEEMLGNKVFVAGGAFSVADISLAGSVHLGALAGVEMARFPNLARWLSSMTSRPAFIKTHDGEVS
jgi:glutathione S-transferase